MNTRHNVGVAARIGTYSDAVEVGPDARWLVTAGTPGVRAADGSMPEEFAAQAVLAWENMIRILHAAGMDVDDIVKVTQYLVRRSDLEAYRPIRSRFLGDARPASMLSFVSELVWPGMLIEIEVVAARR
jgi:enamine deaminase RidA (YjgF/YER057c/UK114 family)